MRILFSGVPAFGHLLPFAPLGRAARRAGHDIRLLTSAGMADLIDSDLPESPVLAAGPMPDVLFAEVARRFPGSDPAHDPRPETVAEFFAGTRVDLTVEDAIAAARAWAPDMIIADSVDFVGPLVAATLGIPWSVLAFGPAVPEEFVAPMFEVVEARYRERGVARTMPTYYIDPTPMTLQVAGWEPPTNRLPFRSEAHARSSGSGFEYPFKPDPLKKTVVVTLGTVFSDARVLQGIVDSVDRSRFNIVATTGPAPDAVLPGDQEGLSYIRFVPLAELLATADIVVNSGGAGTMLACLSRGLPMIMFPQGADQFLNADRAAETGSTLIAHDPSDVGELVVEALASNEITAAAARVEAEISDMPSVDDVIRQLESALRAP